MDSEDVVRYRSIIIEANRLTYDEKYPVLLRNDSKFPSLVVSKCHYDVCHSEVQTTLYNLQNNYRIIRGRQKKVQFIVKNCVLAK